MKRFLLIAAGLLFVCVVVGAGVLVMSVPASLRDAIFEAFFRDPNRPLDPPHEVVLYIHPELKRTELVDPLVCALRRVLVASVTKKQIDLPLGSDLAATRTQLDVDKVADRFVAAAADPNYNRFKYLVVTQDLKAPFMNYVFASRFDKKDKAFRGGVISVYHLDPGLSDPASNANATALRVYKIVLRSVVGLSWYKNKNFDGCVLSFSNNLTEHDDKTAELCEDDRAPLIAAGVLKDKESNSEDCATVPRLQPF
jgi:predicted Zn-dependent protease